MVMLKPRLSSLGASDSNLAIFKAKLSKLMVIAHPITSILTSFGLNIDKSKMK